MDHQPHHDLTPNEDDEFFGLACVGTYPSAAAAHEYGLVILAMGHPCWIRELHDPHEFALLAEPHTIDSIIPELDAYTQEQSEARAPVDNPRDAFPYHAAWPIWIIWAILITAIHYLQQDHPALTEYGANSSIGLIHNHEWWRPITALFLHADWTHLIGNLLSAACFYTLVTRSIGPRIGWFLILLSGTLGNLITACVTWPEPFTSIGASTAVFGALGILSGRGCAYLFTKRNHLPWLQMLGPVLAGFIMLGWLGGGQPGSNTDVLGHLFGFLSGIAGGLCHGWLTCPNEHPSISGTSTAGRDESI